MLTKLMEIYLHLRKYIFLLILLTFLDKDRLSFINYSMKSSKPIQKWPQLIQLWNQNPKNIYCNILIIRKFFNIFCNMFNTKITKVCCIIIFNKESSLRSSVIRVFICVLSFTFIDKLFLIYIPLKSWFILAISLNY